MAKAVVVVDDDVTAPVPAEFPTSRRAPAGATMPGVLGGHGMRGQATRYGGIVKKWRIYPECMAIQLNNEK